MQVSSGPPLLFATSDLLGGSGSLEAYDPNKLTDSQAVPTLGGAGTAAANTTSAGFIMSMRRLPCTTLTARLNFNVVALRNVIASAHSSGMHS